MQRAVALISSVVLAACDLLLLEENVSHDASLPIDAAPDAATCPGGAAPLTHRAPVVADAVLIDPRGGSAQSFGGLPTTYLNFGTSIKSVGIWRFSLAGAPAPAASWLGARVVLEWLPADDDCAPGCGACNAFEEQGTLELYPLRDQWDEQAVTWNARTSSASWSEPGASGIDRGPFAVRAVHTPRQRLVFALGGDGVAIVAPWIANERVSFVVVPKADPNGTTGARMIVPALPPRASCAPPTPPSYFEIDFCPG